MAIKNIPFSRKRKKYISLFSKELNFKYPQTADDFNLGQAFFQRKKHLDNGIDIGKHLDNGIDIVMGENNMYNKLIVMDDFLLLWTTSWVLLINLKLC